MGFRDQRLKAGKSVKEVAEKLGVTHQSIYGFENGRYMPSISILQRMAQCYGCTMEQLLEGEAKPDDESV